MNWLTHACSRALEELQSYGARACARAVCYVVGSRLGKRSFVAELPWGHFKVPANPRKLGVAGYVFSRRQFYERTLQPYFDMSGGTFVDVGANLGFWSCYTAAGRKGPTVARTVVAFEPSDSNYEYLRANTVVAAQRPGAAAVRLEHRAVGSRSETLYLVDANDDPGSKFVSTSGGVRVEVVSLDDWLEANDIHDISLVKIDVEGFEYEVLSGSLRVLTFQRPRIICELIEHHLARNGRQPSDVFGLLRNAGYKAIFAPENAPAQACQNFVTDGNYVFEPLSESPQRQR